VQVVAESVIEGGLPADDRPLEQEVAESAIEGGLPTDNRPPEQEVAESVPEDDSSILETEVAQRPAEPELFIVDSEDELPQGPTLMELENVPNLPLFAEDTESIFTPDGDFDLEYPEMPQGAPIVSESVVLEVASSNDVAALDASMELLDSSEGNRVVPPEPMESTGEVTQHPPSEPPVQETVLEDSDTIPEAMDETEELFGGVEPVIEQPAGVHSFEEVAADFDRSEDDHDHLSVVQSVPAALDALESVQDHDEGE
jgi:hypothetical protein